MSIPVAERHAEHPNTEDTHWLLARQRLDQYLAALDLPKARARRLRDQALAEAATAKGAILPAALATLEDLLAAPEQDDALPIAMPPIQRRPMAPASFQRTDSAQPVPHAVPRPRPLALSFITLLPRR